MDFRGQGKGLALAAMLFGISAAAQAGEGRLLYASLGMVVGVYGILYAEVACADRLGRVLCG